MSIFISCPFCNEMIIEAHEIDGLYEDEVDEDEGYDKDEDEDEMNDNDAEIPEDFNDGECPHLAFLSDWAYAGSRVKDTWEYEMVMFSHMLGLCYDENASKVFIEETKKKASEESAGYDDLRPRDKDSVIHQIADYILDDEDYVIDMLKKTFPEHETYLEKVFVDKGDGVHGSGGPTYMCIFLKKKESKTVNQ